MMVRPPVRPLVRGVAGDAGSAVVEFIVIGVGLLIPMVYAVQAIMVLHTAASASAQAAREAARAFTTSVTPAEGRARAVAAARLAFADQGMALPDQSLELRCVDGPCLAPGSGVIATIDWLVPLPWLPDWWASSTAVPVSATQRLPVDDYRASPEGGA